MKERLSSSSTSTSRILVISSVFLNSSVSSGPVSLLATVLPLLVLVFYPVRRRRPVERAAHPIRLPHPTLPLQRGDMYGRNFLTKGRQKQGTCPCYKITREGEALPVGWDCEK